MIDLVCSVCGSSNWVDVQHSIDKRWPVARCHDHKDSRQVWTPLISGRAFLAKKKLRHDEKPIDIFGGLSVAEQAQLKAHIR